MSAWSPDGREIAYYGFRQGRRRLFVSPVAGGAPVAVAPDSFNQRFPDWAPDGRQLVFHSDRTGRFELYVVAREADGGWGEPQQLTSDGGQEARWSPDGTAIVYVRGTGLWLVARPAAHRAFSSTPVSRRRRTSRCSRSGDLTATASTTRCSTPRAARASGRSRPAAGRRDFWCASTTPSGPLPGGVRHRREAAVLHGGGAGERHLADGAGDEKHGAQLDASFGSCRIEQNIGDSLGPEVNAPITPEKYRSPSRRLSPG